MVNCIIIEATVSNLLILQKYINSKQKILKQKKYFLCLGNASKASTSINMRKTGLNSYVYEFSVEYNIFDIINIINNNKYLRKKHDIK